MISYVYSNICFNTVYGMSCLFFLSSSPLPPTAKIGSLLPSPLPSTVPSHTYKLKIDYGLYWDSIKLYKPWK